MLNINKRSRIVQFKGIVYFILILFILSCNKDDNNPLPEVKVINSLASAGLIEDFEVYEPGENTLYIDPTNSDDIDEDGSQEHPYNSFEDIQWLDSTTYALKRGTIYSGPQILVSADNVVICSFGRGERPKIVCTDKTSVEGNRHGLISHWGGIRNITIRDIEITAPEASSCIRMLSNCDGINIINCKVHDSGWGIRSLGNTNLHIHNTEVYNTKDDGVFIQSTSNIIITNMYVHHVNTNWVDPSTPETEAGGDGIQLSDCNNWHVHHNIIDRRNSGNKFCFISNNADQNVGILEYNVLYGPSYNGTSIYLHNGNGIIIRYNYTAECIGGPVYTHGSNFLIHHNIFNGNGAALYASQSAIVYNNLFYNMTSCISGGEIEVSNNIFDTEQDATPINIQTLTGSNNLFVATDPVQGSSMGNPMYVNEDAEDFHLLSESDCIDKGIYVGIEFDLDGIAIPQNELPDIGPYEFYTN